MEKTILLNEKDDSISHQFVDVKIQGSGAALSSYSPEVIWSAECSENFVAA